MANSETQVAHIWRRLGFGPTKADLDAGVAMGPAAQIDALLARNPASFAACGFPPPADGNADPSACRQLELMAFGPGPSGLTAPSAAYHPVQERVTWLLQGLVVVAMADSVYLPDMQDHIALLRNSYAGSYRTLLQTVSTRPGMLKYLTGYENTRSHPNQNFARELMELFSLGRVHPVTGAANYGQADIVDVARALSGWQYNWGNGSTFFAAGEWDNGAKTFLGAARGAAGLAEVVTAIVAHPSFAVYVPARLYRDITGLTATPAVLDALAGSWGAQGDLGALVSAIAHRPEFLSDQSILSKVKSPVELVVATARLLGWNGLWSGSSDFPNNGWMFRELGQHPLIAPNVSGWPRGDSWLNATNLQRWSYFMNPMVMRGIDWSGSVVGTVVPGVTFLHSNATAATAPTLACQMAGLTVVSTKTSAALADYSTGGPWTVARAAGLLNLLLRSPEFLAN